MKPRQILILGLILSVLIVALVIQRIQKPRGLVTEEFSSLNFNFDVPSVSKVQIGKGGGKGTKDILLFTIVKDDKVGWRIPDFFNAQADPNKIQNLLKEIQKMKGELRAEDKSLYSDFAITEEEAFRIILSDQNWKTLLTLYIGSKRPDYNTIFIRKADSNLVYRTDVNLLGEMGVYGDPEKEKPQMDFWAALNLVKLDVDKVEQLETKRIQGGKEVITSGVVRELDPSDSSKKKWKYVRPNVPFALGADKIKQFLAALGSWQAQKVLDPKAKDYGFTKPQWQMTIQQDAGESKKESMIILAGGTDPETKGYYIQVSGQSVVFLLPDYLFKNFDIDDSKFFADNPLAADPESTESLVIAADKKQLSFKPKVKKWETIANYLNELKTFSVTHLLFEPGEQKKAAASNRRLEIQKTGSPPLIIEVGEAVSEQPKEYAARKADGTQPFAISEPLYKKLFDNLDSLSEPKK